MSSVGGYFPHLPPASPGPAGAQQRTPRRSHYDLTPAIRERPTAHGIGAPRRHLPFFVGRVIQGWTTTEVSRYRSGPPKITMRCQCGRIWSGNEARARKKNECSHSTWERTEVTNV